MFVKYQHVERFGTSGVQGIEDGTCYIFPKIDGANASVWMENGELQFGSRRRHLNGNKDNHGFMETLKKDENIKAYLEKFPNHRLYGEWLVPHTLKTYREDAWKKFYVFDVCIADEEAEEGKKLKYIPYDVYMPALEKHDILFLAPLKIIKNGRFEQFAYVMQTNTTLIQTDKGTGEGIVIKNYDFVNRYGRTNWAKIVDTEFKEQNTKIFGAPKTECSPIEYKIIEDFCTTAFIEKEKAKIEVDKCGWESKYIGELFGRLFHELVTEEIWNIIKKYKMPTIDFKRLNRLMIIKVKELKKEWF